MAPQTRDLLLQTAKDLIRKDYVYAKDAKRMLNPSEFEAAVHNYHVEPTKSYVCPNCMLSIRCPKQWIIYHHKKCVKAANRKDNEVLKGNYHPYLY